MRETHELQEGQQPRGWPSTPRRRRVQSTQRLKVRAELVNLLLRELGG